MTLTLVDEHQPSEVEPLAKFAAAATVNKPEAAFLVFHPRVSRGRTAG
jgi:hypothetical protein